MEVDKMLFAPERILEVWCSWCLQLIRVSPTHHRKLQTAKGCARRMTPRLCFVTACFVTLQHNFYDLIGLSKKVAKLYFLEFRSHLGRSSLKGFYWQAGCASLCLSLRSNGFPNVIAPTVAFFLLRRMAEEDGPLEVRSSAVLSLDFGTKSKGFYWLGKLLHLVVIVGMFLR